VKGANRAGKVKIKESLAFVYLFATLVKLKMKHLEPLSSFYLAERGCRVICCHIFFMQHNYKFGFWK